MTHKLPASEQENRRRRAESRDLRLLVDSLSELIGAGEPLDGMSRSRALGLLIGLERLLPPGHAGALLDKLRHSVQRGAPLIDDNGAGSELSALAEQLRQQCQHWLCAVCGSPGSAGVTA